MGYNEAVEFSDDSEEDSLHDSTSTGVIEFIKNPAADNENPAADNENPIADNENPAADSKEAQNPVADNENPAAINKEAQNPVADNRNPGATVGDGVACTDGAAVRVDTRNPVGVPTASPAAITSPTEACAGHVRTSVSDVVFGYAE